MRIFALITSVIFLTLISCGGVKERKTDSGGSTVENVTNYPDYDSDSSLDLDTTSGLADSESFRSDTLETADDILEKTEIGGDGYESNNNNNNTGSNSTTFNNNTGNNNTGNNTTTNKDKTTTGNTSTNNTTTGNSGGNTTTKSGDNKSTIKKSTTKTYYLIGGSFRKESKAKVLVRQLKKEGYTAEVLPGDNGYNRVAVAKYWKKEDAMKNLQTLRRKYTKMSFWILAH